LTNSGTKIATLTITRYPGWAVPFAFISMVIFRLPLALSRKLSFWRLMGCGKNGTFDKVPDLKQWALLGVLDANYTTEFLNAPSHHELIKKTYGVFIAGWIRIFCIQSHTYLLQPIESHGLWNGKTVFGSLPKNSEYEGEIAVMTRATIRLSKLARFWEHVPDAAAEMASAEGFITSYGVGEWPWVKQATFSIWKSRDNMRQFAYRSNYHKEVIRKTHAEKWYSEEMFTRFRILSRF
jgi:hypothetical protein